MAPVGCNKPHEITVVFGLQAVDAYHDGEYSAEALRRLGAIKSYRFATIPELNAFIHGIEEGQGYLDAIAVDDLKP